MIRMQCKWFRLGRSLVRIEQGGLQVLYITLNFAQNLFIDLAGCVE